MKASTKRALSILFSLFFLIATIVVYTSLIQPEIGAASQLQSVVASKTNAYQNQKNAVSQVSKLISQFQNAGSLENTLSLAMPIGPSVTQALNQWYTVSQTSQASVQTLDIKVGNAFIQSSQPLAKGMGTVTVDLGLLGTYDSLKQFLTSIESNARVINVDSLDLRPVQSQSTAGGGSLYSLGLTVDTYYQSN